jgi:hypothetical protein
LPTSSRAASSRRRRRLQDHHIIAWRSGETNFLHRAYARRLFSACTRHRIGSLWFRITRTLHGKLMALSLLTTLAAAVIFQPAPGGTQQRTYRSLKGEKISQKGGLLQKVTVMA